MVYLSEYLGIVKLYSAINDHLFSTPTLGKTILRFCSIFWAVLPELNLFRSKSQPISPRTHPKSLTYQPGSGCVQTQETAANRTSAQLRFFLTQNADSLCRFGPIFRHYFVGNASCCGNECSSEIWKWGGLQLRIEHFQSLALGIGCRNSIDCKITRDFIRFVGFELCPHLSIFFWLWC